MSANERTCIWIAGATGLVGREALSVLVAGAKWTEVVAVGRRAPDMKLTRLRFVESTDFGNIEAAMIRDRPRAVVCALGTTIAKAGSREAFRAVDFDLPFQLARAARAAAVPVFAMVSSVGADREARGFYLRVKGEIEEAIEGLCFPTLHILRPSLLLGERTEKRTGERIAVKLAPVYSWAMPARVRPIPAAVVGRGLALCAELRLPGKKIWQGEELRVLGM